MSRWRRTARWLRRLAWREDTRGSGALALLTVLAFHLYRFWDKPRAYPDGDGYYSWIFARSLAFDGDIDFTNDYALCGDPWGVGADQGGHRPANPFYAGPAVFLAPILWIVKRFVHIAADAPAAVKNGCHGPLVVAVGAFAPLFVLGTIWIGYRIARRWYSEPACAIGALVVGVASPLASAGSISWYYSHLWAAFAVAIALLVAVRADEAPEKNVRWLLAGAGGGLAALMRPQEALWVLPAVAAIFARAWRTRLYRTALRELVVLTAGFAAVFSVLVVVYVKLYGSPFVIPQGKLYLQLGHAHPWLLLFGARSGFVYWTPCLWLTVIGCFVYVFDGTKRAVAATVVAVMIAQHYLASAALTWTGGGTYGCRVQVSLAAGLIVAAAASTAWLLRWFKRRRWSAGALATLLLGPWILMTWEIPSSTPAFDRPVPAPQLYGSAVTTGLTTIYDAVGNPFSWPATVPFKIRYGAPPKAFDQLATDGIYVKDFRTLSVSQDTLRFNAPPSCWWSDTIDPKNPIVEPGRRARFLVELYWPWTTKVRIHARATGDPADLRVTTASFFRTFDLGTVHVDGEQTVELSVPEGAFDSGINEVAFASTAPLALVSFQWVDDAKRDPGVHLFAPKK